jgi:hypothetical protein
MRLSVSGRGIACLSAVFRCNRSRDCEAAFYPESRDPSNRGPLVRLRSFWRAMLFIDVCGRKDPLGRFEAMAVRSLEGGE